MNKEQQAQALKLLRAISSDIESMAAGADYFGPFSESVDDDDGARVEWPNLRLTGHDIAAFLKGIKS